MEKIIKLENILWKRDGEEILKDISWEVNRGENWAILGLNGSGKTSLLNIITGYNYPTAGSATVLGTEFGKASLPEMRKKIGFVSNALGRFQQTMNRETVENIILSGKFASFGIYQEITPEDAERAASILKDLRLEYISEKRYAVLSQGEQRRVLLGRALMNEPELLILDEPCAGLDVLAREDVLSMTESVARDTLPLLYVTHHIEEITDAISHVLLIRDGEIISQGPKQEVLTTENLSTVYKIPVRMHWEAERPWMSVERPNKESR
ncbi:ABC transporter ATP-binding protein [Salinicoccus sp. ID82-1]|uniref:ABC transporter ATP-binding protein n=1 Tax=Salinicoccus cyprini TaxID=2493691 RepID=A0A558ATQ5_9STAP|nr:MULTISPECIES: ABC transporter ATP-binding protein [Salinicoccus]MCG1010877.1 ABC transporter ATP-binding protein [Salinicoccus sp. ID82-1]TVT27647.1 ABC transporter ATP-binding protein [Salinicoccus cyprini]